MPSSLSKSRFAIAALILVLSLIPACNSKRNENPSVKENVERALKRANLNDVNVDEDRDKNVITLTGKVRSDAEKQQAATVAQGAAAGRIIANEISIQPPGAESEAKAIQSNVDDGIESNYKAALIANRLDKAGIHFHSKNGVLTLTGTVKTLSQRQEAQLAAAKTPNVAQVINELQVKR